MKAGLYLGQAGIPIFAVTPTRERMLQRACACGGSAGFSGECKECKSKKLLGGAMQAKLVINEPGDAYEQEADRVAEQVMRMPAGGADSPIRSSGALVQRRLSGEDGLLSRAAGEESTPVGEQPASDGAAPKDGVTDEGGSRCPSWRGDPESISKRAAETYVQHDITPTSQARVEKITCEPPIANGNYGCFVHFSDGLVVRVIVRARDIVVGMGPGRLVTETPPAATPLCFYDYHCPDGFLVLTKRECKSAKSSAPHPPGAPSAMVQRRGPQVRPFQTLRRRWCRTCWRRLVARWIGRRAVCLSRASGTISARSVSTPMPRRRSLRDRLMPWPTRWDGMWSSAPDSIRPILARGSDS